jgi:hypothetical protein
MRLNQNSKTYWFVPLRRLVKIYWCFGGYCCHHFEVLTRTCKQPTCKTPPSDSTNKQVIILRTILILVGHKELQSRLLSALKISFNILRHWVDKFVYKTQWNCKMNTQMLLCLLFWFPFWYVRLVGWREFVVWNI